MANFEKPIVTPKPDPKPTDGYVYTGEKNYEPPKADPWTQEKK
jgi:hypothetical protein